MRKEVNIYVTKLSSLSEFLLQRFNQVSLRYSTIASQFTQTLSKAKWKGRTLVHSVLYSPLTIHHSKS